MKKTDKLERTTIDPTKITGPYSLLALFLIIVEGLLGAWLYLAQNSLERIIAGILIASILFGFLYVFSRMRKSSEITPVSPQGLPGNVTPAEKEVTEVEVESPQSDMMAGPDRSYLIAKPPGDWSIREITFGELVTGNLGISDASAKKRVVGEDCDDCNILVFDAPVATRITIFPGQSLIDGRKALTALGIDIPTRLAILPMERAQPPLYVERPLEHNFQVVLGQLVAPGLVTLRQVQSGVLPEIGRGFISAELRQDMSNVFVNNVIQNNVSSNIILIGIEGELCDHLIIINYPTLLDDKNSLLEQQLYTLSELVSSFKPLKVANPSVEHEKIKNLADIKFKELFQNNGEAIFFTEFDLLMMRFAGKNLADPDERNNIIKQLQPFETFAKELCLQNVDLDSLWDVMHLAENGDAKKFIKKINEIVKIKTISASENDDKPKK